jgi:hypothetical protein
MQTPCPDSLVNSTDGMLWPPPFRRRNVIVSQQTVVGYDYQWTSEEIQFFQVSDPDLAQMIEWLENKILPQRKKVMAFKAFGYNGSR